jgi:hypothetical protein
MLNRSFQLALLLTGLAAGAPQAAWADSKPCLIEHVGLQAPWTVTKSCPPGDGKCKIYDEKPVYSALSNVQTPEVKELKAKGATFTFEANRKYWIVFFPSSRKVAVRLDFVKGRTDNKTTLAVTGSFAAATWYKGPEVTIAYKNTSDKSMSVFDADHFGKGLDAGEDGKPPVLLKLH